MKRLKEKQRPIQESLDETTVEHGPVEHQQGSASPTLPAPKTATRRAQEAWRTVRHRRERANGEKTAEQSNDESVALNSHTQFQDDPELFSHDSAQAFAIAPGSATAPPKTPGSSFGRRSTVMPGTVTRNSTTVTRTVSNERPLRTAWELPGLIRRPAVSPRRHPTVTMQPWYARLVAYTHWSRFVTASMLQRLFPHWLTSERTAQRHLARLVDHGYLAVVSPWAVGPNFPFVYHATPSGLRFVKQTLGETIRCDPSPAEEKRIRGYGLHSLLHELFISEFTLELMTAVGERVDLQLLDLQRRYFRKDRRLTYFDNGERRKIEPDLGFLTATIAPDGRRSLLPMHFVEVENGTHSMQEIGHKLHAYHRWAATTGREQLANKARHFGLHTGAADFRLLIICHDKYGTVGDTHVLVNWLIRTLEFPRRMRRRLWFCTVDDLQPNRHRTHTLDRPLWYRAGDARHWLTEYRQSTATGSTQQGSRNYRRHRDFIANRLDRMPRHTLFPQPADNQIDPRRKVPDN